MGGSPQTSDRVRQVVVFVLALVAIAGAFFGSGALGGTPIQDAAGGALASDSTLIAPAGPAFSIWSVIYLGLFAYAVWQLFPSQAARAVHRRVGYLIALSMLLNAAWIGVVQLGQVGLSVLVIFVLLAVLGVTFSLLLRTPRNADSKAAVVVAALCGVATAISGRGRLTPAIALAWGLCWVAVARITDEPASQLVGIAAVVAACVVIVVAVVYRVVAQHADSRSAVA